MNGLVRTKNSIGRSNKMRLQQIYKQMGRMIQSYGIRKSKALHQHWTNKHGTMVPKMQFKTLNDCLEYMDKHKINKDKFHPYVCPDCGMWHIGHSKQ